MRSSFLLLALLASTAARAQPAYRSGPTPDSFIPPGYVGLPQTLAYGDLNWDEFLELAFVAVPIHEEALPAATRPPRLLLLLWGSATGYRLATIARHAILCYDCNGLMGEPYLRLDLDHSVLKIIQSGGAAQRWICTAKFRYQQGDFYQIGETYSLAREVDDCPSVPGHRPGDIYRDTNLLTGTYEALRVSEECEVLENRRDKRPVQPLRKLSAYEPVP